MRDDGAGLERFDGLPDELRRVVERADERELFIVRPASVHLHRSSRRAASKEYHASSAAHCGDGLFPYLWPARRIDRDVRSAAIGERAQVRHDVRGGRRVDAVADPERAHAIEPPAGLADDDDATLTRRGDECQQAAERAVAEDRHRLARLHASTLDT